jgi:hypothetical protein
MIRTIVDKFRSRPLTDTLVFNKTHIIDIPIMNDVNLACRVEHGQIIGHVKYSLMTGEIRHMEIQKQFQNRKIGSYL